MKIKSIHIVGFGKFNDFSMDFKDGLQIICRPNEYGKSTIMEFIKMMFYSKRAGEKATSKNRSLRKKYFPWSKNQMGGKIIFEYSGNEYEIQKKLDSSSPSKDEVLFQNISTGEKIILDKSQEIGEYLFGIDVRSFERSSFMGNIGKSDFEIHKNEEDKTAEKIMANFSENSNFTASKRLSEAINDLESVTKRSGKIPKLKCKIDELKIKIHNLKEKENTQQQIQEKIEKLNELKEEKLNIQKHLKSVEDSNYLSKIKNLVSEAENYENLKSEMKKMLCSNELPEDYVYNLKLRIGEIEDSCRRLRDLNFSKPKCKNYKNFQKEYENIKYLSSEKLDSEINLNKLNRFQDSYHSDKNCCDNENLNNLVNDYHNLKSNIFCKKSKNISLALYILNIIFLVASLFTFARIGSNNFIFCIFLFLAGLTGCVNLFKYIKKSQNLKSLKKLDSEINKSIISEKNFLEENLKKYQSEIDKILNDFGLNSVEEFYLNYMATQSAGKISEKCEIIKNEIKISVDYLVKEVSKVRSVESYQQCKNFIEYLEKLKNDMLNLEEKIKIKANILNIDDYSLKNLKSIEKELSSKIDVAHADKLDLPQKIARLAYLNSLNLEEKISNFQKSIVVFDTDSNELEAQLISEEKRLNRMNNYLKSLKIAHSTIENISDNLRKNFSPKLNQRASEIFCDITKNKYKEIHVQKDYGILINNDGFDIDYDKFSNGTIDQAYFSLRVAISELISESSSNVPLILDDIFMQYDDARLLSLLKFLKNYSNLSERQIILFTCHSNVEDLALKNSIIDC